jgi:hypothetical protein
VEEYCHRAMLIDDGLIRHIGDPAEVGRHYLQLNFERGSPEDHKVTQEGGEEVRLLDAWIEDADGARLTNVEHGTRFRLRVELEAMSDLPGLAVGFSIANADGIEVFEFGVAVTKGGELAELAAGERVEVSAEVENLLNHGRYFVHCGVNRAHAAGVALYVQSAINFVVFGGDSHRRGIVSLPHEIEATVESEQNR